MNSIKTSILCSVLLGACASCAAADWDEADTARQAVVLTTFALDYAQTKDIKNHQGLHETNVLMGRHPSDVRVRNYFVAASLAHTAIAYNLPKEWRPAFQYATIALEVAVIIKNKRMGLRYEF